MAMAWGVWWIGWGANLAAWAQALPAGTIATASAVVTVLADDVPRAAGDLVIRETAGASLSTSTGGILLGLPSGVQFSQAPVIVNDTATVLRASLDAATYPTRQIALSVTAASGLALPGAITLSGIRYQIASTVPAGDIAVSLTRGAGQAGLTEMSVTNARVVSPSVTVTATPAPPPFVRGGLSDGRLAPEIRISEGAAGSLRAVLGGPLITLTLPTGVTFHQIPAARGVGLTRVAQVSGAVDLARREFRVTVGRDDGQAGTLSTGPTPGRIEITNIALAIDNTAAAGPITAELTAAAGSNIAAQSITLGQVVTSGVIVAGLGSPVEIIAGRTAQGNLPQIRLEEAIPLTFVQGAVFSVQAPAGVRFNAIPTFGPNPQVNLGGGAGAAGLGVPVNGALVEGNTKAQVLVTARGPEAGAVNISGLVLDVEFLPGTGPIQLTVSGAGIPTPVPVPVATLRRVTTSAVDRSPAPTLRPGRSGQATAGVRITELFFGALEASASGLALVLPTGVLFDLAPSASVPTGNLRVGTATVPAGSSQVLVPITGGSSIPGVLEISNLRVTIPQGFPLGPLTATVRNGALLTPPLPASFPGPPVTPVTRPSEETLVIGHVCPEARPCITEPASGATVARGAPLRIGWTPVPLAFQYGIEHTGVGRTFSNPQGTTVDATNGFGGAGGGFIVGTAGQAVNVVPAASAPAGSYQLRVIGLDRDIQPLGTFSDAVTIQLL
jgi:hypothetical protein